MSNLKPDPYVVGQYTNSKVVYGGQAYLWATQNNVRCVKNGDYTKIRPVAAEFDLSTSCIYHCPWCAYRDSKLNAANVLHDNLKATEVIDELSRAGVLLLTLTGGGEPLLSKSVERTIKAARSNGMSVTLYTNGFLLNRKRSEKIIESGVCEIRISLNDISSQQGYDTAHGAPPNSKLKLDVVINNLVALLSARIAESAELKVGASFVLVDSSARNLKSSLENLVTRLTKEKLNLDYIVVRPAIDYWPQDRSGYSAFLTNPFQTTTTIEKELEAYVGCKELGDMLYSSQRFHAIVEEAAGPSYDSCLAFQTWLNIGPDGTAYVCCETKHDRKFSLGNIMQCRNIDCVTDLMEAPIAIHMRDDEGATLHCPTRLCKPSAYNVMFSQLESVRSEKTGLLSKAVNQWLDDVAKEAEKVHVELKEGRGLSISGIYKVITN